MFKKLEELSRLNDSMNSIIAEVSKCNESLMDEYRQRESVRIEEFLSTMQELASYGAKLARSNYPLHLRSKMVVKPVMYATEREVVLLFAFYHDGRFLIQTNEYTHDKCIYDSELADFGRTCRSGYASVCVFENGWYEHSDRERKFIAENANEIIDEVRSMIEERFESAMKSKMESAMKRNAELVISIERVS